MWIVSGPGVASVASKVASVMRCIISKACVLIVSGNHDCVTSNHTTPHHNKGSKPGYIVIKTSSLELNSEQVKHASMMYLSAPNCIVSLRGNTDSMCGGGGGGWKTIYMHTDYIATERERERERERFQY